ncbi:hypothetical protein [Alcanivorax sp.]|uniref:hypothetical protein n=1 Tax=Alcanivorax sp. TaxID=1872427 RepID=UPI00260C91FB|nr:hypothetical protein [Alcanivorax sp.]
MSQPNQPQNPAIRRSIRLLAAVHELHKQGFQNLAIYASIAPSGMHWRCQLAPWHWLGIEGDCINVTGGETGHEPAYHSSADGGNLYFGWEDARSDTARELADKIKDRFPRLMAASEGRNYRYAGWFTEMLGIAETGALPVMWQEHYSSTPGQIDTTDNRTQIPLPPVPQSWEFQGKRFAYQPGPHLRPGDDWHTAYQRIIDNWRSSEIALLPAYPVDTFSLYEHGAYWEGAIYYIQSILGFTRIDDFLAALERPDPNSERWDTLRWTWDSREQFIYLKAFLVRHMLQDGEKYPMDQPKREKWDEWLKGIEDHLSCPSIASQQLPNPYFGGRNPLHLGLALSHRSDTLIRP